MTTRVMCEGREFLIIDGRRIWTTLPPADYFDEDETTGVANCSDCDPCGSLEPYGYQQA